MKLSKNLLQAVAVGIALGSISSCAVFEDDVEAFVDDAEVTEQIDESTDDPDRCWLDCPACGLG